MLAVDAPLTFGHAGGLAPRRPVEMLDEPKLSLAETKQARALVALVAKLPASGSIVIVHSTTVVDEVRRSIRELRGDAVAGATRVFAAPTLKTEQALTAGIDLPVFRDPMVEAQRDHKRAWSQAWRL